MDYGQNFRQSSNVEDMRYEDIYRSLFLGLQMSPSANLRLLTHPLGNLFTGQPYLPPETPLGMQAGYGQIGGGMDYQIGNGLSEQGIPLPFLSQLGRY